MGRISGKPKPEQQNKSELEKKITAREAELAQVKKQLQEEINSTKKQELEQKVRNLEQQLARLKNNLPPSEKPEKPEPDDKDKIKVRFIGKASSNKSDELSHYAFNNLYGPNIKREGIRIFYISKNHSRIKELSEKGKLKKDKEFIIRYGKVDEIEGIFYTFNEFNQDLEITEA